MAAPQTELPKLWTGDTGVCRAQNVVSSLHLWHGVYQLASLSDGMSMLNAKPYVATHFSGRGTDPRFSRVEYYVDLLSTRALLVRAVPRFNCHFDDSLRAWPCLREFAS